MENEVMNKYHVIDCCDGVMLLPNNSINLVITSPPYNVNIKKDNVHLYKDDIEYKDYILWLKRLFGLIYDKLKIDGRVAINIGNQKNGSIPLVTDIINFMLYELNYNMFSQIVWNKKHTNCRTSWGSWKSPSKPSFPTPYEFILIFSKNSGKLEHTGVTDLTKDEFVKFSLSLWDIKPETRKFNHPAPFPEEIPYRLIKMLTYENDVILDPFAGTGTTLLISEKLNRCFVGIDNDQIYYQEYIKRHQIMFKNTIF